MSKEVLAIKNLMVGFKLRKEVFTAVDNISFKIRRNETRALVGESGSGKSVTALSILQLLPKLRTIYSQDSSILVNGEETIGLNNSALRKIRGNKVSIIFQEPMTSLNPFHKVGNQITESVMSHKKISKHDARSRARELMQLVEIPDLERRFDAFPHELSGGQRQRIMIAMALINEPDLLIADEPTTALDVTIQAQILDLMNRIKEQLGMAILFITHDLGLVEKFSDTVSVMKDGKIVEQGNTKEIFSNPENDYTKKLLNSEPQPKEDITCDDENILQIRNLDVFYKIPSKTLFGSNLFHAVKGVTMDIPRKSTIGVVGESGSGKSTLGKAIINLVDYEGDIIFENRLLRDMSKSELQKVKSDIQIIFQDPYGSLSPRMTIGEIIGEGLDVHKQELTKVQKDAMIKDVMNDVGLDPDLMFKYPHEFSGGQRQRIAIARALILKPRFIILDEPTSALDRSIQIQVIDVLKQLQLKYELTYLFISHDLKVIRSMCDKIFVMSKGSMVEYGNAKEVFNNPKENYTRKLLDASLKYSSEQ